jgi:SRSO17 transposase
MEAQEIKNLGKKLRAFLKQFDDCFYRSQPREHLNSYICGQLSNLQRKSAEPIALATKTPPRTLQRFLSSVHWDQRRLVDRLQWVVAHDHCDPDAIGTVDDTGHPKQGTHTACVQRQWCGNSGKTDNCVISVHTGYSSGDFQSILDSDLYLPKEWADDPERRQEAGIPEDVVYRKKMDIALGQVTRTLRNGIRVFAWTFDAWYGRDGGFLDGLQELGQNYVAEVPSNFTGWVKEPKILLSPRSQQRHERGRKPHFPRLAVKALPASEVGNLATFSRKFQKQRWRKFYIKEGEKGPVVWEVKWSKFYRKQGEDSLPGAPHCLIVARNVLNPDEVKYFVSNMVPGENGISLQKLLWVAFHRWPIESCFRQAKDELGMDHFEVRSWQAIHRHLHISQLSHLFCSRVHQQLREKNSRQSVSDGRTGTLRSINLAASSELSTVGSMAALQLCQPNNSLPSASQPESPTVSYKANMSSTKSIGHRSRETAFLCTG